MKKPLKVLLFLQKLVRMRGPKHIRKASKESKASKVSKARKISTAVTADE